MTIETLTTPPTPEQQTEIVDVYRAAFREPPYNRMEIEVHLFADSFRQQSRRAGFKLVTAREPEMSRLVGFAYGFTCLPGQWWYEQVAAAGGADLARDWLIGAFQVAEVAVHPMWQGEGYGGQVFDTLLAGITQARAVLSTMAVPSPAQQMYRGRGWQVLVAEMHFPGVARPYRILGKELR